MASLTGGSPSFTITGMTYPFGLCVLILALWLLAKILRAADYHLFPPPPLGIPRKVDSFVGAGKSLVQKVHDGRIQIGSFLTANLGSYDLF